MMSILPRLFCVALLAASTLFSCHPSTQTKSEKVALAESDAIVIPFELTPYNNIKFKTVINGKDSLDLKFDSGTTGLLLTHDAIKDRTHLLEDSSENRPTQNYVKLKNKVKLEIGSLHWDSMEIYPVKLSGQGTDGRFGWDLFADKIVSIDYDKGLMTVSDKLPSIEGYSQSSLEEINGLLCFRGSVNAENEDYEGLFLFDTGYQRALLLDSAVMDSQAFPKAKLPVIKTNQLRNGAGKVFVTKVVSIPKLEVGGQEVNDIPTQLLNTPNPAQFRTHILGNELMKRFNTVIDFRKQQIYLKPNHLANEPYIDAS